MEWSILAEFGIRGARSLSELCGFFDRFICNTASLSENEFVILPSYLESFLCRLIETERSLSTSDLENFMTCLASIRFGENRKNEYTKKKIFQVVASSVCYRKKGSFQKLIELLRFSQQQTNNFLEIVLIKVADNLKPSYWKSYNSKHSLPQVDHVIDLIKSKHNELLKKKVIKEALLSYIKNIEGQSIDRYLVLGDAVCHLFLDDSEAIEAIKSATKKWLSLHSYNDQITLISVWNTFVSHPNMFANNKVIHDCISDSLFSNRSARNLKNNHKCLRQLMDTSKENLESGLLSIIFRRTCKELCQEMGDLSDALLWTSSILFNDEFKSPSIEIVMEVFKTYMGNFSFSRFDFDFMLKMGNEPLSILYQMHFEPRFEVILGPLRDKVKEASEACLTLFKCNAFCMDMLNTLRDLMSGRKRELIESLSLMTLPSSMEIETCINNYHFMEERIKDSLICHSTTIDKVLRGYYCTSSDVQTLSEKYADVQQGNQNVSVSTIPFENLIKDENTLRNYRKTNDFCLQVGASQTIISRRPTWSTRICIFILLHIIIFIIRR